MSLLPPSTPFSSLSSLDTASPMVQYDLLPQLPFSRLVSYPCPLTIPDTHYVASHASALQTSVKNGNVFDAHSSTLRRFLATFDLCIKFICIVNLSVMSLQDSRHYPDNLHFQRRNRQTGLWIIYGCLQAEI